MDFFVYGRCPVGVRFVSSRVHVVSRWHIRPCPRVLSFSFLLFKKKEEKRRKRRERGKYIKQWAVSMDTVDTVDTVISYFGEKSEKSSGRS